MSNSVLDAKHFHDEAAAYAYLEGKIWPNGPVCPHCQSGERIGKMQGKSTRLGVYKCYACRKPFRVTVGTVFEASHIPLRLWLQAVHLMACSKKGVSANQLHRILGVTLKSAWFMAHRVRKAMEQIGVAPIGGEGKVVEADETYHGWVEEPTDVSTRGKKFKSRYGSGVANKRAVLALVERGGEARTFHIATADIKTVHSIMRANVAKQSRVHTDESGLYHIAPWYFAKHETVKHSADEYVRGDVTTNSVEGYFSIFKRGMKGVYQHCSEKHLHRYLAEFEFRFNDRIARGIDDVNRADRALRGIVGKRLTYHQTNH